jgi:hypothetical protein
LDSASRVPKHFYIRGISAIKGKKFKKQGKVKREVKNTAVHVLIKVYQTRPFFSQLSSFWKVPLRTAHLHKKAGKL